MPSPPSSRIRRRPAGLGVVALLAAAPPVLAQADCPALVWADEFDGAQLDTTAWSYQLGDGTELGIPGWGNNERQFYQRENARLEDGELVITARPDSAGGYPYTSARLRTKGKVDFTYGTVVARARVPAGGGTWPAIWMLSTDEPYGTWPKSGEIDIMEYIGNDPTELLGTVHYGLDFPNNSFTSRRLESLTGPLHEDYHEYRVDWVADTIHWAYDGYRYGTVTRAEVEARGLRWPFDDDFHLIVNLAVGGNLGGAVTPADYPAEFRLDYLRVYNGALPYVTGPREATAGAGPVTFAVAGAGADSLVEVDLAGREPGEVVGVELAAFPDTSCVEGQALRVDVLVEAAVAQTRAYTIENFDSAGAPLTSFTGALDTIADPVPDDTLAAGDVGRYTRNAAELFDVAFYDVSALDALDGAALVEGREVFTVDLQTDAPAGTELLLQLESEAAAPENFPAGRHSRYRAVVPEGLGDGAFARLEFELLDRPDGGVPDDALTRLVLLVAPNSNTAGVYTYDNLDVYRVEEAGGGEGPPTGDNGLDTLAVRYVIDDFDAARAPVTFATGTLEVVADPVPGDTLARGDVGRYARAAGSLFDVLVYAVTGVDSLAPDALAVGEQAFAFDLLTDAPAGTELLLQLETAAAGDNFPVGRHSRYQAFVPAGAADTFRRVRFAPLDRPDGEAAAADVTQLVLLVAPNSNTGGVYTYDNLVVYGPDLASALAPAPAAEPLALGYDRAAAQLRVGLGGALARPATWHLVDLAGRTSRAGRLAAGTVSFGLDVAALPAGVHVVQVAGDGRRWVGRFAR